MRPSPLQVCHNSVTLLAGMDRISTWELASARLSAANTTQRILAATHAGPFLLLQLSGGAAVLLAEDEENSVLAPLPATSHLLSNASGSASDSALTAVNLFTDTSGWVADVMRGSAVRHPIVDSPHS